LEFVLDFGFRIWSLKGMSQLWHLILYQPLLNGLILLYKLIGNIGLAIVVFTVLIRAILIPLTVPSMKAAKKMQELAPELEKLKRRYKNDKQGMARAQMELYKQHGANPAAGCLPQIVQLLILIALYQAFRQVLLPNGMEVIQKLNEVLYPSLRLPLETSIDLRFLYLDLAKPDVFQLPVSGQTIPIPGLFLLAAALTQFLSSKMMSPGARAAEKAAEKTEEKTDDLATSMQSQMLYLFPLMTLLIGFTFPSGLILYWFIFSLFTMVQQYFVAGPGGLGVWLKKLRR
jgi:YidC/Oxa1 family membrane protein insertase